MAKGKKSFVLYADLIETVSHLSDGQAGQLFKLILDYVNDKKPDEPTELVMRVAFSPIKISLKRDLSKWEKNKKSRSMAGKKGGIKSGESRRNKANQNEANEASASKSKQNEANEAVSVSVSVNGSVSVSDNVINILKEGEAEKIIEYCAITMRRQYTKERIGALWKAFIIQNNHESYGSKPKQLKHFQNWLKNQSEDGKRKQGTSEARIESAKNF